MPIGDAKVQILRDKFFPLLGFVNTRIELKSKGGVVRAFAAKQFSRQWRMQEFPLRFNRPTVLNEITLVFSHDKAGTSKRGAIEMKDFTLIPADLPEETPALTPATSAEKNA